MLGTDSDQADPVSLCLCQCLLHGIPTAHDFNNLGVHDSSLSMPLAQAILCALDISIRFLASLQQKKIGACTFRDGARVAGAIHGNLGEVDRTEHASNAGGRERRFDDQCRPGRFAQQVFGNRSKEHALEATMSMTAYHHQVRSRLLSDCTDYLKCMAFMHNDGKRYFSQHAGSESFDSLTDGTTFPLQLSRKGFRRSPGEIRRQFQPYSMYDFDPRTE
jgi:hypothetical protein